MKNKMYHWKFTVPVLFLAAILLIGWAITGEKSDNQQQQRSTQPETMPLVPMMQQLLTDIQQVDRGIYTENFQLIGEASGRISDHPKMIQEDKKIIKKTLGKEMKKFVSFDMRVHHHADSMRMAALQKEMQEVLRHYRIVQKGCVDCHSNYRKEISEVKK
jgi:cytochrome c556